MCTHTETILSDGQVKIYFNTFFFTPGRGGQWYPEDLPPAELDALFIDDNQQNQNSNKDTEQGNYWKGHHKGDANRWLCDGDTCMV